MKKNSILISVVAFIFLLACQSHDEQLKKDSMTIINQKTIDQTVEQILQEIDENNRFRVERGVAQVARFWHEADGQQEDFVSFCKTNFIADDNKLYDFFNKASYYLEILFGNFNKMNVELKKVLHLDKGEITPLDIMFGSYNPASHLTDDLFANKIAHKVLLNFPFYFLEEKEKKGEDWTRRQWAYARMGDVFTSRTPAALLLKSSKVSTQADNYIAEYNIVMQNLRDKNGEALYDEDLRLISHWGLRDDLKSNYSEGEKGLARQKMIYEVMTRIVRQEIPEKVVNNDNYIWNPYSNTLFDNDGAEIDFKKEPSTRYAHLLNNFKALSAIDDYAPHYPTYIQRAFDESLQLGQEYVEALFIELVSSEQAKKVGELIEERLGRKLKPFDIWYDGFKSRSAINEDLLTQKTFAKYPTAQAFEDDIPDILIKLGYTPQKAAEIASKIVVEGSRGAGHAWGAQMRSEKAHLRTRLTPQGMDYKGYNIAMHELGHNVEQTITLQDVDYYMLRGVPNTAFTEAMAFMFQTRDLAILGIENTNPNEKYYQTLDIFWGNYEIMGVSLVDMNVWKWLYENPDATPEALQKQVVEIAKDIWNKYYAPVFGIQDSPILAIYSHMIAYPLYLSAYPLGHLIEFQIEEFLKTNNANFADETHRMFVAGNIVPQLWMLNAVKQELSNEPMLKAVDEAIEKLK